MKIRTDFVTNSSSSSFCVSIIIEDKKGRSFEFEDSPLDYSPDDGGCATFDGDLASLLKKEYRKYGDVPKNVRLIGNRYNNRTKNVTKIKVGDSVEFKESKNKYGIESIEVVSGDMSIGYLPVETMYQVEDLMKMNDVTAIVSKIVPAAQKSIYSDGAEVEIDMKLSSNEEMQGDALEERSVRSLCKYLMDSVSDDLSVWDLDEFDDEDPDDEDSLSYIKIQQEEEKVYFIRRVSDKIENVSEISKIIVKREYDAWGEFAECVADNDRRLCELAEEVISKSGEEKELAKRKMLDYINTPNKERKMGSFGCDDFRYYWCEDDDLEELAERLCSNYGPGQVSGYEYMELDAQTGKITEYSVFGLN